jgi:mevalonate kinase
MEQLFYAHGKLLLSGEYLVLKGAKALALPTIFGQKLQVKSMSGLPFLHWKSFEREQLWFEAKFFLPSFDIESSNLTNIAETLQKLLLTAFELSDSTILINSSYEVEANLEFDRNWGLGSSSTLVSLVAQWIGCNAFELNTRVFGGSGYDIACAQSSTPIVYELQKKNPVFKGVDFQPPFASQMWFIHLNQKQNSRSEIARFDATKNYSTQIEQVNILTNRMLTATSFTEFSKYMDQHEQLISSVIGRETVRKLLFPDFEGSIKSLGAWGGDFVMACTNLPPTEVHNYFTNKGFTTVVPSNEMILK